MKILGITHPIPTEYANRIYNEGKNVFVSKRQLSKATKGDKFVIYESHGAKAYTGWADILSIQKMKPNSILRKFGKRMMITREEFKDYSKNMPEMNVIELENFEKFKTPVKPKGYYVTVAGKYIYEDEYKTIVKNKG